MTEPQTDSYVAEALASVRITAWELDVRTGLVRSTGPEDRVVAGDAPLGRHLAAVHPDDRARVVVALQTLIAEGRAEERVEFRMLTPEGPVRYVEGVYRTAERGADGRAVRVVGVAADVTSRQAVRVELAATAARLRSYVATSRDAVWCFELEVGIPVALPPEAQFERLLDAKLVECSDHYAALRSARPEELRGRAMRELLQTRIDVLKQIFLRAVAQDYAVVEEPIEQRNADGTVRHGIAAVTGVVEDGALRRVWGSFSDVTDRVRGERERAALEAQLQQAQRLESLGALAGGVAHDFNNLLVAIGGNAQVALEELASDNPARATLKEIHEAAVRAAEITQRLLAFSREQPSRRVPFSAERLVDGLAPVLRRLIPESIKVDFEVHRPLPSVLGDAPSIEQAILSLVVNARDACRGAGSVRVTVAPAELDEGACVGKAWARPGRYVRIDVTDDGPGIPAEHLDRIFEPFFTTKSVGEGTGLGLSLVYGTIVRQHGGLLQVTTERGRGATFSAYLPVSTELPASSPAPRASTAPQAGAILLAEDEPAVRRVAVRLLEREGYRVTAVGDGLDAVDAFSKTPDEFALVMLDVVMPRLGGRAAFDRISALRPEQRVLFVTGYASGMIDDSVVDRKRRWLLPKPWSTEALLGAVRFAIDAP